MFVSQKAKIEDRGVLYEARRRLVHEVCQKYKSELAATRDIWRSEYHGRPKPFFLYSESKKIAYCRQSKVYISGGSLMII